MNPMYETMAWMAVGIVLALVALIGLAIRLFSDYDSPAVPRHGKREWGE